jgi:hypothetical protein
MLAHWSRCICFGLAVAREYPNLVCRCNIAISFVVAPPSRFEIVSVIAFHEKAGCSQVGYSLIPIPQQGFFSAELPLLPPFHPHS